MPKKTYQEQTTHLGSCGELKPKYPNAPEEQMALLEVEGISFVKKGKKCVYWVVEKDIG